jgi:hypothetical protein
MKKIFRLLACIMLGVGILCYHDLFGKVCIVMGTVIIVFDEEIINILEGLY